MLETLLSFVFATATLAISPGPDNIFVLTQSIVNGKKYGLATVAGLMTGCIIHTTLVAFGVSEVIKQNPSLFFVIKLLGAGYLLYLAFQVYKSDAKIAFSPPLLTTSSITVFWSNDLVNEVASFSLKLTDATSSR